MQRLKKAIRRIAAIGVGAAMIGATMTSAVALDLSEYPAPFIVNGEFDTSNAIVVGESAAASDTLGAMDLAAQMQFDAKKAISTPGGTVSVTGGVTEDIPLGRSIANSTSFALNWEVDDSDVSSLQDTTIQFRGADYNVHDIIAFTKTNVGSPSIETSLTSSEDDYESNIFMETISGAIRYYYLFDESIIPYNTTTTEPLTLKFLGKTLKITKVDSAGEKFTAYVGNEYFMKAGDSVTIDGKKVTLSNVGSGGSIVIDVDGTLETIPADTTETVNGIEISNDETFYEDTKSERSAHLVIGKDAQGTYKDGDAFIGEDESNPDWIWTISGLNPSSATATTVNSSFGTSGPVLGVKSDFTKDDAGDNPAGIGECYDLPNNYVSVCLDSLTVPETDYLTVHIKYKSGEDTSKSKHVLASSSARTIKIWADGTDRFVIPAATMQDKNGTLNDNDIKTSTVWLQATTAPGNSTMVYYSAPDSSPNIVYLGQMNDTGSAAQRNFLRMNYKDTKDTNVEFDWLYLNDTSNNIVYNIVVDVQGDSTSELENNADDLYINVSNTRGTGFSSLGVTASTEEASELSWKGGVASALTGLGTKDEEHRTRYGIIIKDPKSNGGSDEVVLEIPGDQVQANVVVKGQATAVSGGATSYVSTKIDVNPMMDTEVTDPTAHNLILVGGPAVNSIVKDLIGADWKYASGEALIKLMTNGSKVALIVAGTDAIDTRMACKVIANYKDYKLETTEQVVTGTISAPTIKTA